MGTRKNSWTDSEVATLRRLYTRMPVAQVAVAVGRTLHATRTRANRLGLSTRPPHWNWCASELNRLKREYGRTPIDRLAAEFGRSAKSVYLKAQSLGLTSGVPRFSVLELLEIRALNADGLGDEEIAKQLGRERHSVSTHRERMGLPSNARGPRFRERIRLASIDQCRRAGVRNLGELRSKVMRERVRKTGWPEDLRPRQAQILDHLFRHGTATRKELCAALGMTWRGTRNSLCSNDPEGTYLAHLIRRGLVIPLGRVYRQGYQWEQIYGLAHRASPRKENA